MSGEVCQFQVMSFSCPTCNMGCGGRSNSSHIRPQDRRHILRITAIRRCLGPRHDRASMHVLDSLHTDCHGTDRNNLLSSYLGSGGKSHYIGNTGLLRQAPGSQDSQGWQQRSWVHIESSRDLHRELMGTQGRRARCGWEPGHNRCQHSK